MGQVTIYLDHETEKKMIQLIKKFQRVSGLKVEDWY